MGKFYFLSRFFLNGDSDHSQHLIESKMYKDHSFAFQEDLTNSICIVLKKQMVMKIGKFLDAEYDSGHLWLERIKYLFHRGSKSLKVNTLALSSLILTIIEPLSFSYLCSLHKLKSALSPVV